MKRFSCLLFALSTCLIFIVNTVSAEYSSADCKNCHREIHKRALVSFSQHRVARDKCVICHASHQPGASNPAGEGGLRKITLPTFSQEVVIPLKNLKKGSQYQVEIVASDPNGTKSAAKILAIKLVKQGVAQDEIRIINEEIDRVSLILRTLTTFQTRGMIHGSSCFRFQIRGGSCSKLFEGQRW